jgi:23S rRNA A1618 N6-methylase RlmF
MESNAFTNNCQKRKLYTNSNDVFSFESLLSPNFEELARQFPDFRKAYQTMAIRQQQSTAPKSLSTCMTPELLRALTRALLHLHWGLTLTHLPEDRLCPPVPNRYFYVHWLMHTVLPSTTTGSQTFDPMPLHQTVLDIGTGALCIYPLLWAASIRQSSSSSSSKNTDADWHMYATDIDATSVRMAQANVASNGFQSCIHVLQVAPSYAQEQQQQQQQQTLSNATATANPLPNVPTMITPTTNHHAMHSNSSAPGPLRQSLAALPYPTPCDVVMTNPPFYDFATSSDNHQFPPRRGDNRNRTPMQVMEGCYPGGEMGFVLDMIADALYCFIRLDAVNSDTIGTATSSSSSSLSYYPLPTWLSCMCAHKATVHAVQGLLRQLFGHARVVTTEFGPGQLTRWFVAWTLTARPHGTSPYASTMEWSFAVSHDACDESSAPPSVWVMDRLQDYCTHMQSQYPLRMTVCPNNPPATHASTVTSVPMVHIVEDPIAHMTKWPGDEDLPLRFRELIQQLGPSRRNAFLPGQGHFVLQVSVHVETPSRYRRPGGTIPLPTRGGNPVTVHCQGWYHTKHGKQVLDRIQASLQGEVCRSNRRWRRKLQRGTIGPSLPMIPNGGGILLEPPQAMDLS